MKVLNLTFRNINKLNPSILIDEKPVKLKKNENGFYVGKIETEKDEVCLKVQKYHELYGKFWFLMGMLFFVISLFGILDLRLTKNYVIFESLFKIKLNESETNFAGILNSTSQNGKAMEFACDGEVKEEYNKCYVDDIIKKRRKILRISKILTWIALIGLILYFIVESVI